MFKIRRVLLWNVVEIDKTQRFLFELLSPFLEFRSICIFKEGWAIEKIDFIGFGVSCGFIVCCRRILIVEFKVLSLLVPKLMILVV